MKQYQSELVEETNVLPNLGKRLTLLSGAGWKLSNLVLIKSYYKENELNERHLFLLIIEKDSEIA